MPGSLQTGSLFLNLKNIIGWKTQRKIIAFSVDDYGNVRLASKKAREAMDKAGMKIYDRFDAHDSLETEEDLLSLFEVLNSVKDKNNNPAVFTPFTLPANINFEKVAESGYSEFFYESLPETFAKLKGYEKVFGLWKEGISKRLLVPELHGREHLNVNMFIELLEKKDKETLVNLQNRSYTSISAKYYPTIQYTAAFDFYEFSENDKLKNILDDGVKLFKKVFGFNPSTFMAPSSSYNSTLDNTLNENGVNYLDYSLIRNEHIGLGKYKKSLNYSGKKNKLGQTILVRNCAFEPTAHRSIDWVSYCLQQIEAAFKWNRPAIISSHRVNFCGLVDPENRAVGLGDLKKLLIKIVTRWPEVEFMSIKEIGDLVSRKTQI